MGAWQGSATRRGTSSTAPCERTAALACLLPAPALSPAPLLAGGAGFGGRLFNQIRSREGLAYSVSGGWTATPIDHPGLFIATAETAQPAALLAALRGALDEAVAAPPPAQEMQRAKQVGLGGRRGGGGGSAC